MPNIMSGVSNNSKRKFERPRVIYNNLHMKVSGYPSLGESLRKAPAHRRRRLAPNREASGANVQIYRYQ